MRESYSKNPLMRLVFVVADEYSENEKKQTEKEAKKNSKSKILFVCFPFESLSLSSSLFYSLVGLILITSLILITNARARLRERERKREKERREERDSSERGERERVR